MNVESVYQEAKEKLDNRQFKEARDLGHLLLKQRFSGAFEILAASFHGTGEIQIAITVLENGLREAPNVWLLWLQLGNYRSELGDLQGAIEAYQQARQCPGAEIQQLEFNEAFLRLSFGNKDRALELFENVIKNTDDKRLKLVALTHRLSTLIELDRITEALMELGEAYLHEADNAELLTTLAGKLLEKDDQINALNLAKQALGLNRAGDAARVVRLIEGEVSHGLQLYEVHLKGKLLEDEEWIHFYKSSHVYAQNSDEAQKLAIAFEPVDVQPDLKVESTEAQGERLTTAKGVNWSSVLAFSEV